MNPEPAPDLLSLPWRTHSESSRGLGIIYAQTGDEESAVNVLIGMMDSPAMAAETCLLHNERLAAKPAGDPLA